MDNKKDIEKMTKQEKNRADSIKRVMKDTGWTEAETIFKIEDCRQRLGISYNDYCLMRMYQFEPEVQEVHYREGLKKRQQQMIALEKCAAAVVDETGWNRETAVKNIKDSIKRFGIQYRDYIQMELFRIPTERQEAYYQNYTEKEAIQNEANKPLVSSKQEIDSSENVSKHHALLKSEVCDFFGISFDGIEEQYTELTIVSRAKPGSLVFLLRFPKRKDTHEGQEAEDEEELARIAFKKGAKRVLCTKPLPDYPCLIVQTEDLFTDIIRLLRSRRDQLPVKSVEVTGSYGKTTVMNMLEAMFETKFIVLGNKGENYNMVRSAMRRIQKVTVSTDIYLQEAAENLIGTPGDIAEIIGPNVAIITSIGTSHIEKVGSQEKILESCLTVQNGMTKEDLLVLNGDDPFLRKAETKIPTVYYSTQWSGADYYAKNIVETDDEISFDIVHLGEAVPARIRCIGRHNVSNALAVYAAGVSLGMSKKEATDGLLAYAPLGMRQNLLRQGGFQFYLDCYNASVESMKSSLDTLSSMRLLSEGKKIAVLADILETGSYEERFHREIGRYICNCSLDVLICYGDNAKYIAEEAASKKDLQIYQAETHNEIIKLLREIASPKDVILLKGSHGMALELVPDRILGTWLHEYGKTPTKYTGKNFIYRLYKDHAVVQSMCGFKNAVWIPDYPKKELPVTSIGSKAFENAEAEIIVLPSTLSSIRKAAFRNMKKLRTIRFPSALRMVDEEAFRGCEQLKRIIINNGCLTLSRCSFQDCVSLDTVEIPSSVVQISEDAFEGCKNLQFFGERGSYAERYALLHNIPFYIS